MQVLPTAQGEQVPSQSRSLSVPFLTPSVQDGAAHCPLTQFAEVQSPAMLQAAFGAHFMHDPPQSVSLSSPSLIPSVQDGAAQTPDEQTKPDKQSLLVAHLAMAWHLVEHDPPQSTSDSVPFLSVSVQVGMIVQSLPLPHSVVFTSQNGNTNPAIPASKIG